MTYLLVGVLYNPDRIVLGCSRCWWRGCHDSDGAVQVM